MRDFIKADKEGYIVKWDEEGAYAQIRIREVDRPLTTFHVPTRGWSQRVAGDFGNATCGYAWDAVGRAIVTAFHIMSHRAVIQGSKVRLKKLKLEGVEVPDEWQGSTQGWAKRSRKEVMLSPRGERILEGMEVKVEEGMVDMRYVSRWVDDFIKVSKNKQEAEKVRRLVIFLHTRYGVKLAKDKLEGPQRRADFGGGDFIAKGTWLSIPDEKRIKYAGDLEKVVAGEMIDVKFMDTVRGGPLAMVHEVLPQGEAICEGDESVQGSDDKGD